MPHYITAFTRKYCDKAYRNHSDKSQDRLGLSSFYSVDGGLGNQSFFNTNNTPPGIFGQIWDFLTTSDCESVGGNDNCGACCCAGVAIDPGTMCCENGSVVSKESVWIGRVQIAGLLGMHLPVIVNHSNVYAQNPSSTGPTPPSNTNPGYGFGPSGAWSILGVMLLPTIGNVLGDDIRPVIYPPKEIKVCPKDRKYLLSQHNIMFYWGASWFNNCHGYANQWNLLGVGICQ